MDYFICFFYFVLDSLLAAYCVHKFFQALSLPFQELFTVRFVSYTLLVWVGELLRCLGLSLALFAAYLVWGPKRRHFLGVKKYVAVAIFFEGVYFLCLLPTNILRIVDGNLPFFVYFAFVSQILLVSPFLFILSLKVFRYQETAKAKLLRWSSVAALSYLAGIWIVNVLRWISMAESEGIGIIGYQISGSSIADQKRAL